MIVLASASASRRAMLEAAGVSMESRAPAIDERALEDRLAGTGPAQLCTALAEAKALAISAIMPERLVLGGDSLVTVEGRRFDKPATRDEAAQHLRFFSGRWMELHGAAALARQGRIVWRHHALARLLVRPLSDRFIAHYLDAEWPQIAACAGAFRIEALGAQLFSAIEGDHFTVLGLPLLAVLDALREQGELEA